MGFGSRINIWIQNRKFYFIYYETFLPTVCISPIPGKMKAVEEIPTKRTGVVPSLNMSLISALKWCFYQVVTPLQNLLAIFSSHFLS